MWLEFFALIVLIILLFYRWATANNDFFKKKGMAHDKPVLLLGSFMDMLQKKKSMYDVIIDLYNKHNGKVFGIFDQRQPLYLIRDPELIKQIGMRDFEHFSNHRNAFLENDLVDSDIFGSSLIFLKNAKWKEMRSTLSPAFTGCKLRQTFLLMNKIAQQACDHIKQEEQQLTESQKEGVELNFKDFAKRFTSDIIASLAFGIEVDSFKDENNEFHSMAKKLTNFTAWQTIKYVLNTNFNKLSKLLKIEYIDRKLCNYFKGIVVHSMNYRRQHNIHRADMINMLMESSVSSATFKWNDIEMSAQCLLFFFAGFETMATVMSFTAHELMENPEIQDKLYEEIALATDELGDGPLTYEVLQKMHYLDQIISEVLRKWPGTLATDRLCNKDISYELDNGEQLEIKAGEPVWFPINALHMDEKYWPNPKKFDPERFSEENKKKIIPFTYIPFGVGPRNCIGSRLAILEAKAMIYYLVKEFRIVVGEKTCQPFKLSTSVFTLEPEGGFWLKFISRTAE